MTAGIATWRRIGWAATVVLTGVGVAQWWLGDPALALLAASYVGVLGLLTRALPVRVAVSAALLVQQAVLLLLVLVVPLLLGGPLRPGVALGVLLVPCLAVVADVLLPRRAEAGDSVQVPLPLVGAACAGGVAMVVTVLLAGRADSFGLAAWSASGDARLHLLFARMVLEEGGLHGTPFSFQPEYQEALTAVLLDSHGRGTLAPGPLLEHDLRAVGQVSTALTVLWTLASTATLLGFASLRARAAAAVVGAASLLPVTGLALGVVLRDGFLPILLLVPLLLAALTVLAWLNTTDLTGWSGTVAVGVPAVAIPVLAFTWTPHAVVVGVAALVPWLRVLRAGDQRTVRLALMTIGTVTGASYCLFVLSRAGGFIDIPGSIASPTPAMALLVPILVLLVAAGRWSAVDVGAFVPYLVGTVAAAGIVAYAVAVQAEGLPWNYFPAKIAWTWMLAGLPLLLVPFAHPRVAPGRPLTAAAGATGVVIGALALSPVTSPVLPHQIAWLQSGLTPTQTIAEWDQPDVDSLRLAVSLGHPRTRFVVHAVSPEDDRLTNFWLAAYDPYDGPTNEDEFITWGYYETGTVADICGLLDIQPYRVVATADPNAEEQLRQECGREVRVRMVRESASRAAP
jgi:hypothetical protein